MVSPVSENLFGPAHRKTAGADAVTDAMGVAPGHGACRCIECSCIMRAEQGGDGKRTVAVDSDEASICNTCVVADEKDECAVGGENSLERSEASIGISS